MRFAIQVNLGGRSLTEIKDIAKAAEAHGFDALMVDDHFWGSNSFEHFDAWTLIAGLSAITSRIKLGTLVTSQSFRHPSILAKIATTVDHLSEGRLEFGIGAGWVREEHVAFGFAFLSDRERFEQLEESIRVIRLLWTGKQVTYDGKHFRIKMARCLPKPIQDTHPPILVGGVGGPRFLRIVATLAQGCNLIWCSPARAKEAFASLRRYCSAEGRDSNRIDKSVTLKINLLLSDADQSDRADAGSNDSGNGCAESHSLSSGNGVIQCTVEDCIGIINEYIGSGADRVFVRFMNPCYVNAMNDFATSVMPEFK